MATFGEVSEPSSRALIEWDADDAESGNNVPKLEWQLPLELPDEIGKFFIFEGKNLWSGVRAKKTIQEVNCVKEANLHLYKTPRTHHYVAVVKDCDMLMNQAVVKLLKDMLAKSKMIVTIQEKTIAEYQSEQPPTTANVIRKIRTANEVNTMKENLPKLEQPNMITGISAGVFTLREQLGLSSTAIVIYMENTPDSQVDEVENLLKKMDMSGAAQVKPTDDAVSNSNLYT